MNNPGIKTVTVRNFIEDCPKWSIINAWIPLNTVIDLPLILCDTNSISHKDIIRDIKRKTKTTLKDDGDDPIIVSDFSSLQYNENQRWYYYPLMQSNEVIFFQQYNSEQDFDNFVPTFHTAVDMFPNTSANLINRESIEFRFITSLEN